MFQDVFRFSLLLFLCAGAAYGIHYYVTGIILPERPLELINFAYKINLGFTLLFTTTIIVISKSLAQQVGLIYLLSGVIKLGIFLFLIKTSSFEIGRNVFLHFFVPYVVCVVVEIVYIIKILKGINYGKDS